MRIAETPSDLQKIGKGGVLSIGNFDGVHTGHQQILAVAKQTAEKKGTELIVLTFEPHPIVILDSKIPHGVLTPLALKRHLLAQLGVDCLFVLKTTPELLSLSPADFVDQFLTRGTAPSVVVEGEDFNFGAGRSGNIHTLHSLGQEKGFEVVTVEAEVVKLSIGHAVRVSSTMIRNLLEAGKVDDAAVALARPYRLIGKVVPGHGRGKRLGFPTANIEPTRQITPAEGVYAGLVQIGDSLERVCGAKEKLPAALSVGRSETFGGEYPITAEAHILADDVADLSGKWLATDFIAHIRSQRKFDSEKALAEQIANDCENAKRILADYD